MRPGLRCIDRAKGRDNSSGIHRHCSCLRIIIGNIQHERLKIAVKDESDQLPISVDDWAARVAANDVGCAREIQRRPQESFILLQSGPLIQPPLG